MFHFTMNGFLCLLSEWVMLFLNLLRLNCTLRVSLVASYCILQPNFQQRIYQNTIFLRTPFIFNSNWQCCLYTLNVPSIYFDFLVFKPYFPFIFYRLTPREFNSYGSRRGNDEVMARGTFANIRLVNKFMGKPGPKTVHIPSSKH